MKEQQYKIRIEWSGNVGEGTAFYNAYQRDFRLSAYNKGQVILGSSDPAFLGDPERFNPEEMLVASISSCHMLWYLHLCASQKIVVTSYDDHAEGFMQEKEDGSGFFSKVILKPKITLFNIADQHKADLLHKKANEMCFIANSCNFEILHEASYSENTLY
ncbi:OsmC family protein [Namhaeicola litoreus]|uniref:OsmC family protein n=1 Tax=Namhaeicola litoreus TaxID=1052145 RepID=A0ABW3XZ71_9FLAO